MRQSKKSKHNTISTAAYVGDSYPFNALAASELINHLNCDDDLESTRSTWLEADRAYVCFGIVEVAPSETPAVLSDRRIEHWGPNQIYIGRACYLVGEIIVEVVWDPLCQDISHVYTKENVSAHGSLRPRCMARYDHSSFSPIPDILTSVRKWCTSAL